MYIPQESHDLMARGLYSAPPNAQTAMARNPALLVSWWCTAFALTLIVVRLMGRFIRTEKLFREDKIMAWAVVPLLIRMAFCHCILRWGTNNANLSNMTEQDLYYRGIASRLVLPARIFYAMFLWICKFTLAEFLKRLYGQVWRESFEKGLKLLRCFLLVTFAAVVVSTLTECHPFDHYWQVLPDPGPHCRQAYVQLITLGTSDIITDLVLVCFPIPIIIKSSMPIRRKFSLSCLFSLSLILVVTTLYRVTGTIDRRGNQQFRSLLASVEILAAAFVANAIVLGSFVRDRGVKKARFKYGSASGTSSLDRPSLAKTRPRAAMSWGSDIDLVSDLGLRLPPEFSARKSSVARPAPAVLPLGSSTTDLITPAAPSWTFPGRDSAETDESSFKFREAEADSPVSPNTMLTPRRMSFFDVGGLLGHDAPRSKSSVPFDVGGLLHDYNIKAKARSKSIVPAHLDELGEVVPLCELRSAPAASTNLARPPFPGSAIRLRSPMGSRRGSHALLNDIGGLTLYPPPRETSERSPSTAVEL